MLLSESNAVVASVVEQRIIINRKELMNLHGGADAKLEREVRETDEHEPVVPILCQIINEILKQTEVNNDYS